MSEGGLGTYAHGSHRDRGSEPSESPPGRPRADTLFGVELPAMASWAFGTERAAAIGCPVLSMLGTDTLPLFVEVAALLRSSLPDVEECVIDGVGHLLHIQSPEPVARAMSEFLRNHARAGD